MIKFVKNPRLTRVILILLIFIILTMEYIEDSVEPECTKEKIDTVVKEIIKSKEKKLKYKLVNSCKAGILRGCVRVA